MADFAFAVAVNAFAEQVTVSLQHGITFLAPARGKEIVAEARCVRSGRSTCFYTVTISDELGTAVALSLIHILGIGGGAGDVQPIAGSHALHLLQGANLLADFLPKADELIGHGPVQPVQIILLARNEVVHAIQGHPAVIADDAPAAVSIRQAGQKPGVARYAGCLLYTSRCV